MKTDVHLEQVVKTLLLGLVILVTTLAATGDSKADSQISRTVRWSDLGAKAAVQYSGAGLAVVAGESGRIRLQCAFQKLEGELTDQGLWLNSTVADQAEDRFRVAADYVGRDGGTMVALAGRGMVENQEGKARFIRPGLWEEYSVSVDGVRQDFIVGQKPSGSGKLRVELSVSGAKAEPLVTGARLVIGSSERQLAYSRLRVTDANQKELPAQLEVVSGTRLAVLVDDSTATYPVRVDPTFSDANWVSMGALPGADGEVSAAVTDVSGNLYIGGSFKVVGPIVANGVAKWDGTSWSALGSGMSLPGVTASVNALAVVGNDLYAAGWFHSAGGVVATNIARWNGTSWSSLGSGTEGVVYALAASGNDLYAGGDFFRAGGLLVNKIAKWNAASGWSALGSGMDLDPGWLVRALAVSGGNLYAGGYFDSAGGIPASNIARWNGSSWSALGAGLDGTVWSLAVSGTTLYAGGFFTYAGSIEANRIAKWNGNAWSALGTGLSRDATWATDLAVANGILYVGGNFYDAGGVSVNGFARWNGINWSAASPLLNSVGALAVHSNRLFAAGVAASGGYRWDIATQTGGPWSSLGGGAGASPLLDGSVLALTGSGSELYVGGKFTSAGGVQANHVAKWNGTSWSPLGDGVNNWVYALAVSGGDLYVGGAFTSAGGIPTPGVARWNGTSWSPVGEPSAGAYPVIIDLAVSGGNVFAGGAFGSIGGVPANNIARWDGTKWSALGLGLETAFNSWPTVNRLVFLGDDLYVAGGFVNAGGNPANRIAKWDGNTWSPLGDGMDSAVAALAVSGNELYAGGFFSTAGGTPAAGLAKWNGTSWESLVTGVNGGSVSDITLVGNNLYAVGWFDAAAGEPPQRIAKWNSASGWSASGSSLDGALYRDVYAIAALGSDLFVGGSFSTAGGKASAYLARAYLVAPPGGTPDSITFSPGAATIKFYGNPGRQFDVLRARNLTPPVAWTKVNVTPLSPGPDGVFTFTDSSAPSGGAYHRSVEQ